MNKRTLNIWEKIILKGPKYYYQTWFQLFPNHEIVNSLACSVHFNKESEFSLKTSWHSTQHLTNCFVANYLINTCFFTSSGNQVFLQTSGTKEPVHCFVEVCNSFSHAISGKGLFWKCCMHPIAFLAKYSFK